MSRPRTTAAVSVALAITALGAATAIGASGRQAGPHAGLRLAGHVTGLFPGARRTLTIRVRNRTRRALRLRAITTHVRDAGPRCRGRNLRVSPFRGRLRIRPRGFRRVQVTVQMSADSPSTCQGAVFPLVFRGLATAR